MLPRSATNRFRVASPPRVVGCDEYDCDAYLHGWETRVPRDQYDRVRGLLRGRYSFTEAFDGEQAVFTFTPGQECFIGVNGMHRVPWVGRERFIERRGILPATVHVRADDWVDSFANNQIRLASALERG